MINRDSLQTYQTQDSAIRNSDVRLSEQFIKTQQKSEVPEQEPKSKKQRLNSLDVFRGLTMIGMIMVDNMGPYPPWFLDHAQWNGLTPADLIFPGFLFIMGVAIPLAVSQKNPFRLRTVIRILGLFAIGVFLNLSARKFNFQHFRILGILQRISVCYAIVVIIHWVTKYGNRQRNLRIIGAVLAIALMMTYLAFMIPFQDLEIDCPHSKNLSEFCNFGGYLDRMIFGQLHMIYPNDPEGLFTNLSALLNTYAGYWFCLIMLENKNTHKTLKMWVIISLICGLIVYPLTYLMPLNKKIWSISFVFATVGISGLSLTFFAIVVDIFGAHGRIYSKVINFLTRPLLWLGRNPLIIFVLMDALAIILIKYIIIDDKSAWSHFYHYVFASWISDQEVASTIFSVFFVLLWTAVSGILFRFKIFIRL